MKTDYVVNFKSWVCLAYLGRYGNGRLAITLQDRINSEPIAVATVNLPNDAQDDDEVFIKAWSENSGMVEALLEAGIIEPPYDRIPTGFVHAEVCKLMPEFLALVKEFPELII